MFCININLYILYSSYIVLQKLPKVNPDFARKLIEAKEEATAGNKKKMKVNLIIVFTILFYRQD